MQYIYIYNYIYVWVIEPTKSITTLFSICCSRSARGPMVSENSENTTQDLWLAVQHLGYFAVTPEAALNVTLHLKPPSNVILLVVIVYLCVYPMRSPPLVAWLRSSNSSTAPVASSNPYLREDTVPVGSFQEILGNFISYEHF